MDASAVNPVHRVPWAAPETAAAFFRARMACQTDVSDVHAALESGRPGFVLVDTRSVAAWRQGRIPGAVHLPTDDVPQRAGESLGGADLVVTYCWGPGCNGATRAAVALSELGYRVKEMLGGMEYWVREGLPVESTHGVTRREADPLTVAPAEAVCQC